MSREEAIEIFKRLKENAPNEMHLETVGSAQELFEMAIQALSQEPCRYWQNGKCNGNTEVCDDAISRKDAEQMFRNIRCHLKPQDYKSAEEFNTRDLMLLNAEQMIHALPSVTQKSGKWIPVSERLPEDLEPVNITWVNHEPEPYYHDIKDRNFVATGIYYRGQWYWYSTTCADYLGEYGSNEIDKVDDAVEIIAWMPLPKPYEPQESEE